MRTISPLTLLICACLSTAAQAQDALEPCEMEFLGEYYQGVEDRIDSAVGVKPELSLTTLPSFAPESGVRLVGSDIYYVEFQSSFWEEVVTVASSGKDNMDFASPEVKTNIYHSTLSSGITNKVTQAYARAISNVRKSDLMGADGVSYRFTKPGLGCGRAWSPNQRTYNARLVQLLELLGKHATLSKPREIRRTEKLIIESIQQLEAN